MTRRELGGRANVWAMLARGIQLPSARSHDIDALLKTIKDDGRLVMHPPYPPGDEPSADVSIGDGYLVIELAKRRYERWDLVAALVTDPGHDGWKQLRTREPTVGRTWADYDRARVAEAASVPVTTRARQRQTL